MAHPVGSEQQKAGYSKHQLTCVPNRVRKGFHAQKMTKNETLLAN
jgi:hypothetical protein